MAKEQKGLTVKEKIPAYYTYQVPRHLYEKLERKALARRKKTGEIYRWTDIIREMLEKKLSPKKPQD